MFPASDFNQNWMHEHITVKLSNTKFYGDMSSFSRVSSCRQTDGQREREVYGEENRHSFATFRWRGANKKITAVI